MPAFAKANPKAIVLVARSSDALKVVEDDVTKLNSNVQVLSVPTDITDDSSVTALFDAVKGTLWNCRCPHQQRRSPGRGKRSTKGRCLQGLVE